MTDKKPSEIDMSNTSLGLILDGPMQMTFDNKTKEIVVKCYMMTPISPTPMQVHLCFTKDGTGHLFGGILEMVNKGMVTVTAGENPTLQ